MLPRRAVTGAVALVVALVLTACGGSEPAPAAAPPTLTISAIPDQDPQQLQCLYDQVSSYLGGQLGVPVGRGG